MKFFSRLKSASINTPSIVNKAFDKVVIEPGSAIDSETAKKIKQQTISAMKTASSIAKNIGDVNGDGKVDVEDLKLAAQKAGLIWDKIDPDLREALILGGIAGIGVNVIPFVGQLAAMPVFLGGTALFYIKAKIAVLSGHRQAPASGSKQDVTTKDNAVLDKASGEEQAQKVEG